MKFEKVSFEQYKKDLLDCYPGLPWSDEEIRKEWENIKLPTRATRGSAGYDFYAPSAMDIVEGEYEKFPTGIRCKMYSGWVLVLFPRSGHGFKYGARLVNTAGIIDSDYYDSSNEGHIHCKLTCDKTYRLEPGQAYMQGIFLRYGITEDDNTEGVRDGGFGSTDKG